MDLNLSPETVSWLVNTELATVLELREVEGDSFNEIAALFYLLKNALEHCQNRPVTIHISC